jgi:hypothetical protein
MGRDRGSLDLSGSGALPALGDLELPADSIEGGSPRLEVVNHPRKIITTPPMRIWLCTVSKDFPEEVTNLSIKHYRLTIELSNGSAA